jgi:hypothetical protein
LLTIFYSERPEFELYNLSKYRLKKNLKFFDTLKIKIIPKLPRVYSHSEPAPTTAPSTGCLL